MFQKTRNKINTFYVTVILKPKDEIKVMDIKDTDGKHIDPIHSVFVIVPVEGSVTAKQNSGLTALWLNDRWQGNRQ